MVPHQGHRNVLMKAAKATFLLGIAVLFLALIGHGSLLCFPYRLSPSEETWFRWVMSCVWMLYVVTICIGVIGVAVGRGTLYSVFSTVIIAISILCFLSGTFRHSARRERPLSGRVGGDGSQ